MQQTSNPTKLSEEQEHKGIYSQANVKNIVDEALNYQKQQLLLEIEGMPWITNPTLNGEHLISREKVLALLTNK